MHYPSTQNLAYQDSRNLNRTFPGRPDGNLTERTSFAISELIRREKIDMTIDVHEASLGYPVVSTYVCHQRAEELCMMAAMMLSAEQFPMKTETSPTSLRGLTHREIGDFTDSLAVLMETPEPFIDKFVGPMTEELMLTGRDEFVQTAADARPALHGLRHQDRRVDRLPRRPAPGRGGRGHQADGRVLPGEDRAASVADLRGGDGEGHRALPARPGEGGPAEGVQELRVLETDGAVPERADRSRRTAMG